MANRRPRQRSRAKQDVAQPAVGDVELGLLGVSMRSEPHTLPPGLAVSAINMRFTEGVPETRRGTVKPPWVNKTVAGDVQPWGTIYGAGEFSDPVLLQAYGIIAADGAVYFTQENSGAVSIPLPDGVSITYPVRFVQCFDVLLMFRSEDGTERTPLRLTSITGIFEEVVQTTVAITRAVKEVGDTEILVTVTTSAKHRRLTSNRVEIGGCDQVAYNGDFVITKVSDYVFTYTIDADLVEENSDDDETDPVPARAATGDDIRIDDNGTNIIPNGKYGLFFQNRLLIPNDADEVIASDEGDYTRYVPVHREFRINQGSADKLVSVDKFNDVTVVCWKDHSISAVLNIYGDLSAMQQDTLTREFGLVAQRSVAQVGNELWGLTDWGIMAVRQTDLNKLQVSRVPVSDEIKPLIDHINWTHASGARAVLHDSKYYLAVPLDSAEVFRDELAAHRTTDASMDALVRGLVVGASYRWEPLVAGSSGSPDQSINFGSGTLTVAGTFVATQENCTIRAAAGGTPFLTTLQGSLRRVFIGVNNAILVYDLLTKKWAGHDQSVGVEVVEFVILTYKGRRRLFVINPEGYIWLYEDGYEDEISEPYADLEIIATPVTNTTITPGVGSALVTTVVAAGNGVNQWHLGASQAEAARWAWGSPVQGSYGWNQQQTNPWVLSNVRSVPLANGVRFYGSNGVLPKITLGGVDTSWLRVTEVSQQPIECEVTFRGMPSAYAQVLQRAEWVGLDMETWWPKYSVSIITPGVGEATEVVTDRTRSRVAYTRPFDAADWDPLNTNDDHGQAHREDYALLLGGAEGSASLLMGANGLDYSLHQEVRDTIKIREYGRNVLVKVTNKRGRIRVMGLHYEGKARISPAGRET